MTSCWLPSGAIVRKLKADKRWERPLMFSTTPRTSIPVCTDGEMFHQMLHRCTTKVLQVDFSDLRII